ncbi:disease resistance protein L6-like [Cornus florida]|uniref:disease resistance protein L6-like n=1 Tax=Cornus florida TaxID=4283 RepID=UPI00289ACA06|nr:disease resistance protein L6-like [Cornus florida]XP_059657850.1 disease resistance protein L6-like [Cornus florida]XP_059657859.1 disease resistance protein L6-like [Cornus florida]XP_059657865.1 disease resistance protein L6-like [Cornus florida]
MDTKNRNVFKIKKKKKKTSNTSLPPSSNTSSSSTSPPAGGWDYEVFLSFRGADTRQNFTDHLYHGLMDAGIHTFRDDDELRFGERISDELLEAIQHSKISIPVFSKDYASSKWCLNELNKMVERKRTLGQLILPIFYYVEPSDVRNQKGSYEEAFQKHEEKYKDDSATVEGWKKSLREVGELKGWSVNNIRPQGKLVKKVVSKVWRELKKNYSLVVNECLVGIDDHVEEMMKLLSVNSNDVRIVGIHGMGGIGKTTVAKVIFDKLSRQFHSRCFLEDVRKTAQQHNGLVELQNQLISSILKQGRPVLIGSMDEGIIAIKRRFSGKKVLLVVDDVDCSDHLRAFALLGNRDWFGSGSRIIITTRDPDILKQAVVNSTYEPKELDDYQALQLFSKYAFRTDHPPQDYHTLSRDFVHATGRLPLALEIIGSRLFSIEKKEWEDKLKELKMMPNEDVQKKLQTSYDALNDIQKQIFLDIACLFIGVDTRIASHMWESNINIGVLLRRSLVKIGDNNELVMHEQLRDLGRNIVRRDEINDPGEHSRVWLHEEAFHILESSTGTRKVEAICVNFELESQAKALTNEDFANLSNLRFLQVGNAELDGDFKRLLLKLRWLRWNGCPQIFRPTNFRLKNLVILDLSRSDITEAWEGWNRIKEFATKLKVLNLTCCKNMVSTPDFSAYANLERLILEDCENLDHIDPSIGKLNSLFFLNVKNCTKLKSLPLGFDSVEELLIDGTSIQEVPIGKGVKNLQCLSLKESYLKELPDSIGKLESLNELRLSGANFTELPDTIGNLEHLRILEVRFPNLKEIKDLDRFKSLEFLDMSLCESLERLPDLSNMEMLEELKLVRCQKLHLIGGLKAMKSLKLLELSWCTALERLPDLSNSEMLEELILYQCEKLQEIEGLKGLKSLKMMDLSSCIALGRIPDLSNSAMLKELKLYRCEKLQEIEGLEGLKSLKMLDLSSCTALERLPDLSNSEMLKEMKLHMCQKLHVIEGLKGLKTLKMLDLSWCTALERLPDISNSEKLEELKLCLCQNLQVIEGLKGLKSLKMVDLSSCTALERLPDLSNSEMLEDLMLYRCEKLHKIEGLQGLKSLKMLDLSSCIALERLPELSNSEKLEKLMLHGCEKLHEIEGFKGLKSLKLLDLSCCATLKKLPDLSNSEKLEELMLHGCKKLHVVEGFMGLKSLTLLDLSCCTTLEKLPDLSTLTKLEKLLLHKCEKLGEILGLEKLKSVELLDISECKSLKCPDISNIREVGR